MMTVWISGLPGWTQSAVVNMEVLDAFLSPSFGDIKEQIMLNSQKVSVTVVKHPPSIISTTAEKIIPVQATATISTSMNTELTSK